MKRTLCISLFAVAAVGCASMSTMQTASAVPDGKFRFDVAPEFVGVGSNSGFGTVPQLELGGRYGLGNGMDVGFKLWLLGFEADFKKELMNDGTNIFSLAPGLGYFNFSGSSDGTTSSFQNINVYLPILYGIKTGGGSEFVVGPKLLDSLYMFSGGGNNSTANVVWVGATVGYAFKMGESFRLMPEFNVMYPLIGSASASTSSGSSSGSSVASATGVLFQGAIGFHFGG